MKKRTFIATVDFGVVAPDKQTAHKIMKEFIERYIAQNPLEIKTGEVDTRFGLDVFLCDETEWDGEELDE